MYLKYTHKAAYMHRQTDGRTDEQMDIYSIITIYSILTQRNTQYTYIVYTRSIHAWMDGLTQEQMDRAIYMPYIL